MGVSWVFSKIKFMNDLEQYITSYLSLHRGDLEKIESLFKETSLKKGRYFLKAGRQCDTLSFVESGLLRIFATMEEGEKQVNIIFLLPTEREKNHIKNGGFAALGVTVNFLYTCISFSGTKKISCVLNIRSPNKGDKVLNAS